MYSACFGLKVVSFTPIFSRCKRATSSSSFLGRVYTPILYVSLFFQVDLRERLVGEAVAHHEAGMTGGAAQIHQAAFRQHKDAWPSGNVYISTCGLMLVLYPSALLSRST